MLKEYLIPACKDYGRHVECQDYVINNHARTVMSHRALKGVFSRYTVNRAIQPHMIPTPPLLYAHRPEIPMIVEHVCSNAELLRDALRDKDQIATIISDEEYIAREFLTEQPSVIEMEETEIFSEFPNGQYRVFDFLKRCPGVSGVEFSAWLDREGDHLASLSEFRSVASKRVHNRVSPVVALYAAVGGSSATTERNYDAIVETWTSSLDGFAALLPEMRHRHAHHVDPDSSFSVVTSEHVLIADHS
jgi:hypothetical protein